MANDTATTITTSTADFKPGDTMRIDHGSRPGWYQVVEVRPGTIGVDQQPGNRPERSASDHPHQPIDLAIDVG